jgi:hypothetical protein
MTRLGINFNDVPDQILPLPDSLYHFEITEVPTIAPTKKGNGTNFNFIGRVSEGEGIGRTVKGNLFLGNDIGKVRMKKFIVACGFNASDDPDTADFLGRTFWATTKTEVLPPKEEGGDSLTINKYGDFVTKK